MTGPWDDRDIRELVALVHATDEQTVALIELWSDSVGPDRARVTTGHGCHGWAGSGRRHLLERTESGWVLRASEEWMR